MIVALSDLHLGLPSAPDPRALAPLFDGAFQVILNGDATELSTARFAPRAAEQLALLRETIASSGAASLVLAGNHDPGASPAMHTTISDGAIIVTHGHAFHPMIVPWSPFARAVGAAHAQDWDAHPELPPLDRALHATSAAAVIERAREAARPPWVDLAHMCLRPWQSMQVVAYWRIYPELAANFRRRFVPHSRVVVCGHSHRAGAWWMGDCLVLNTGSFTFPGTPHAVLIEGEEVVLVPLQRKRGAWRYVAEARRIWRMGEIASAATAMRTPVA